MLALSKLGEGQKQVILEKGKRIKHNKDKGGSGDEKRDKLTCYPTLKTLYPLRQLRGGQGREEGWE